MSNFPTQNKIPSFPWSWRIFFFPENFLTFGNPDYTLTQLMHQPSKIHWNLFSAVKVESLGRVLKTKACQGESLTMSCRKDPLNTIIIFQASYGRDSEVCPYKPSKPLPFKQIFEGEGSKDPLGFRCEEDVTKTIDKRCGWKKACNVAVDSSVSDLCGPGANQYLSVAYSCGKVPEVCLKPH